MLKLALEFLHILRAALQPLQALSQSLLACKLRVGWTTTGSIMLPRTSASIAVTWVKVWSRTFSMSPPHRHRRGLIEALVHRQGERVGRMPVFSA